MQISEVDFTLEEVPKIPLSLLKVYVYFTALGRFIKCSLFSPHWDFADKRKNGGGTKRQESTVRTDNKIPSPHRPITVYI